MASFPRKYLSNNEACYMCFVCPDYCTKSNIILSPSPPPQKYQIMSPFLIIMLICILAAFFLLFSYVISRCRYNSSPRNILTMDENQGSRDSHNWFIQITAGLPRTIIDSIRVVRYKRGEVLLPDCCCCCMICLSEFEEEERLRILTKCGHAFHVACIDIWLMSHLNCPVCRASLLIFKDLDTSNDHINAATSHQAGDCEARLEVGVPNQDFTHKMDMIIRRSLSVDFLHGTSSIRRLHELVPIKRSSSFTAGNTH